jgi:hypothetical protein
VPAPDTDLIDLVNEHKGVADPRALHALDELAGHGSDVRPSVPLDLRHVGQAADGEAVELSVQRVRDALADGRLAHARRAHHADDLALHRPLELAHRDELENALLHVAHAVVVRVQYRARGG